MSVGDIPWQISFDRTGMDPDEPLVIKNDGTTPLTLVAYREPAIQTRVRNAPTADDTHGEQDLAWSYQDTLMLFSVAARDAPSEAFARAAIAELVAAISRLAYPVAVTPNDAPVETWRGKQPITVSPGDARLYHDLRDHDPVWNVSCTCYPVRS